ncbi:MAG: hypothetical protein IPO37_02605 [Saprospiraceae bacterium]|nr:hypothetical protein [Saprospiraceae bacterium]MBP6741026.1 hypothetical protein [Leptospiraceae bacterium]
MINWHYFPETKSPEEKVKKVLNVFLKKEKDFVSKTTIIKELGKELQKLGFDFGSNKKQSVPILYGEKGKILRSIETDILNIKDKIYLHITDDDILESRELYKLIFDCSILQVGTLILVVKNKDKYENLIDFISEVLSRETTIWIYVKEILIIGF